MSFSYQQSVGKYNKEAIPGDRANNQEVIYTPENLVAKGGTAVAVQVGNFAWRDTTNPELCVGGGTGAPVGFVERVQDNPNYEISTEGTLVVPGGATAEIAVKGDFFIEADATTSAGATVYATLSNGAPTLTSVSGSTVDTGFTTWGATTSGSMAIITKR